MASKRKQYTPEFKFKVVMESFQRDTTIEAACRKFDVLSSLRCAWRTPQRCEGALPYASARASNESHLVIPEKVA